MAAAVFLISIDALVGTVPAQHAVNHAADQRNAGAAAVGIARAIGIAGATVIDRSTAIITVVTAIVAATVSGDMASAAIVAAAVSGNMPSAAMGSRHMPAMTGGCMRAGAMPRRRC